MKKAAICVCTAALAIGTALPMNAMAAGVIYGTSGIGQKVVIGGSFARDGLPGIQINGGNLAGIGDDCAVSAVIGGNRPMVPGQGGTGGTKPEQGGSDGTNPGQGGSDGTNPGQGGSDGTNPGQGGSGGMNPGQGGTGQEKPDQNGSGQEKPGQPDNDGDEEDMAEQVAELVNRERAKAGLAPLRWNAAAAGAAQKRAQELAKSFSHTRPDGSSFSTALSEAGVRYSGSGENIAYGQTGAEQVMNQWMNSSGHRANILNSDYTSIGVGHYVSPSGVHYWTQLFFR